MLHLQSSLPVVIVTVLMFSHPTGAFDCPPNIIGELWIGYLPMKTIKSPSGTPIWPIEAIMQTMASEWDSYLPTPPEKNIVCRAYGTCYNVSFVHINYPKEEWGSKDIYNKQTLSDLANVDLVVGHHLPAVEKYCKANKLPYILSLPPTIEIEDRMLAENNSERVMFSAWPSWKNFFELSAKAFWASRGNWEKDLSTIGRVFIFVEGPDGELNAIANKLAQVLMLSDGIGVRASAVFVRMYDMQKMDGYSFYAMLSYIFNMIKQFEADIVVYMYKLENKLWPLMETSTFFSRMLSVVANTVDKIEWLFWDMRTDFNGILSELLKSAGYRLAESLRLRSISLYNAKPFGLSCDNITTDISEIVGANDAASMAILNTATIAEPDFTRAKLLETMRETKEYIAGVKSRQQHNWVNIYSGWSFNDGFRVYAAVCIGLAIPNASYSGAGAHEDSYATTPHDDSDRFDVFTDCKPKLEYFLSYYWEDKLNRVVAHTEPQEIMLKQDHETMKIVAVLEEPFVIAMGGNDGINDAGYSGIAHAILTEAFYRMSLRTSKVYKYKIYHTAGNEYGRFNQSTKAWTGAFGELQQKKAVMAIGMISKTIRRKRDFDFTPAYEFVGITFTLKLSRRTPDLGAFMMPFKSHVWWGLLAVMLISCVFIYLLDRWNPFMEEIEPEKRFNMNESTWYSFGAITQAGGEFAPIMYPTRVYSIFYWFFALVVTACYTGNLASFLVEQDMSLNFGGISDIPHLAKKLKTNLKWGTLKGSYMEEHIRGNGSKNDLTDLAKRLNYDRNYKEGTDRAKKGGYAFIGTNLLLQYYAAKDPDCKLAVDPNIESFTEIAFPMRRDWPLRKDFKIAMNSMRDDGTFKNELQRWIAITKCVAANDDEDDQIQLRFEGFTGLFILLGVFYALSYIVLFIKLAALKLKEKHEKLQKESEGKVNSNDDESAGIPMVEEGDGKDGERVSTV
ncbi:glutamate receptor ionotropic, NMDA 1-like [Lineus longissimus]|uniref:glutamate receptor ionotropic, NMDA 1-like n=1 Tax=Lineus longissimus TaxID=88925 RepID=UPI002B4FA04B